MQRGNKVVLFDRLPDPLCRSSAIVYESHRVFGNFEQLNVDWKYQKKLNLLRQRPIGVKAVIVRDLDQLPGEVAARQELAGLVELLTCYSVDEVCVMTGLEASLVHAVYFESRA